MATHLKRNGSGDLDFHWGFIEKVLAGAAITLLTTSVIAQVRLHIQVAVMDERLSNVERIVAPPQPATPSLDTHKVVL